MTAEKANLVGVEVALVVSPFHAQGEYMVMAVDGKDRGAAPTFDGYYVQAGYFLTSEHRKYSKKSGTFGRLTPRENYNFRTGGLGSWEIAFRMSQLDLNDSRIRGGRLTDYSAALNWYLNPNVRLMMNMIRADLDGIGDANIGQMRMQVDF